MNADNEGIIRWVSCAGDVNPVVARERHLLRAGFDTTLCGATGVGDGVWRGNTTKPKCRTCENRAEAMREEVAA